MKLNKNALVLLACVALLLTFAVSGTVAYLVDGSGPVVNEFTPVNATPSVTENFDHKVKRDVKIENKGNIDVYIRAKIIVTWQNNSGDVLATVPVQGQDYSISWGTNTGWGSMASDGYFYHATKVAPGNTTGVLVAECKPLTAAPVEGYTLHVEILAQSIQADGKNASGRYAVEEAWGVTVNPTNKTISK